MNIGNNFSASFQGRNYIQRIARGHLKDGSTAVIRITQDKNTFAVKSLEAYQYNKGKLISGAGEGNNNGMDAFDVANFIGKLEKNAKEGVDFGIEIFRTMM